MGQRFDRFFAGSPKPLRLFSLGFVIALLGVALGFGIDYAQGNPLAYVAFGTVVLGVAIGFIAVAWGWYAFFKPSGGHGNRRGV
jgi:1,4-dihydroxy-2-naphthoate octaprenyltransferase